MTDKSSYLDKMAKIHGVVSLEMARELEAAGFSQSIGAGDWGYLTVTKCEDMGDKAVFLTLFANVFVYLNEINKGNTVVKAPKLGQLLAEIEARGYAWRLDAEKVWKTLGYGEHYGIEIWTDSNYDGYNAPCYNSVCADLDGISPEEAAAAALIWIYQQKAGVSA